MGVASSQLTQTSGQPPTHQPRARSRAVQSVPWVTESSDVRVFSLFPDEASLRDVPHAEHREKWRPWEVVGLRVYHFMDDNCSHLRQDSEGEDNDEDAAECLLKHRVQRLTCEVTTSESQRPRQAEVMRANDHPQGQLGGRSA